MIEGHGIEQLPLVKAMGGLKLVPGIGVGEVRQPVDTGPGPDVLICTPSLFGVPCLEYQVSVLSTITACIANGIRCDVAFVRGDAFIGKARNNLVQQFIERKAQSLFFIDDDEGWDVEAFLRMVRDPHEIVAGAVPKKMDPITFNNVDLITDADKNCVVDNGLLKVRTVGTGFMRITKAAMDKYLAAYPETYNPGDGSQPLHHLVFEQQIIDGQFFGEDLVFCKRWEKIGGELWIDPNVSFKHVGRNVWTGNFLSYLKETCKVEMRQAA